MVSIIFCLYVSRLGPLFSGSLPTDDFAPSSLFSSFFFFSDPFLWFCPSSSLSSGSSFDASLDGSSGRRSVSSSCARVELLVELNSEILKNNDFYTVRVKTGNGRSTRIHLSWISSSSISSMSSSFSFGKNSLIHPSSSSTKFGSLRIENVVLPDASFGSGLNLKKKNHVIFGIKFQPNLQGFLRFRDFLCLSSGNDCITLVVFKVFDSFGFFGICVYKSFFPKKNSQKSPI